jgi:2-iminobutanoate/2-iminopropanoate deaminase
MSDSTQRRHVNLPGRADLPFSDGVLAGDTFYMAGRLGLDPATGRPPPDPDDEARLMLEGVRAALALVDMKMRDLVSVQIYCSDVSLFGRFNAVYRTFFEGSELPARAFLGSGPLLFGARFEIVGVALRRG